MRGRSLHEAARLGVLAVVAAWLLHPFATSRMYGAGDALWYANMLADFVIQLRHGVFPIFAGQTEYAFNGAVYPLRVAPLYQHLAGLIDLLTGRSLTFITLQHLTVIVCGVAGLYGSYFTLCRLAPERRWSAVGFATLYLSCPGLLGTIYTQDLYMTWMTVPLAPLAVYGILRTFRKDDITSQVWLAAPLAALWWAHSPIALWFTFIAAASQVYRLARGHHGTAPLKRAAIGALLFGVLAQYPFVSVAEIRAPGVESNVVGTLDHPEKLMGFVRSVFPAALEPLSDHARELSDLQLGYALWFVFSVSVVAVALSRNRELLVLVGASLLLLALVLPVPGITAALWSLIPSSVVRITYYWPMQRFYLILAALLTAAGQIILDLRKLRRSEVHSAFLVMLGVGCGWSLWESRQFIRAAHERTASKVVSERIHRPENILLMDHAYGLFPQLPAYFTNGVVDPGSQVRLLDSGSGNPVPAVHAEPVQQGAFVGVVDSNPGILDLSPVLHLQPDRHYSLEIDFAGRADTGILQLEGDFLFREYALPSSGGALAFGIGNGHARTLDLWTSSSSGEDVHLRFIPQTIGARAADFMDFGRFSLREAGDRRHPVDLQNLVPFTADVKSGDPVLVETPRMFMPGYRSSIDGHEATPVCSAQGLVSLMLQPGDHVVSVWYVGTPLLRISFWSALSAWVAIFVAATASAFRPRS